MSEKYKYLCVQVLCCTIGEEIPMIEKPIVDASNRKALKCSEFTEKAAALMKKFRRHTIISRKITGFPPTVMQYAKFKSLVNVTVEFIQLALQTEFVQAYELELKFSRELKQTDPREAVRRVSGETGTPLNALMT
jgi:hypothetical protein